MPISISGFLPGMWVSDDLSFLFLHLSAEGPTAFHSHLRVDKHKGFYLPLPQIASG